MQRGAFALWGLFGVVVSGVSQTDQTHFTNWVWYFQSAFFILQAINLWKGMPNTGSYNHTLYRTALVLDVVILPIIFINTFSVLVLSTYIWVDGSRVFERYEDEYGEAKVQAGNLLLHALPFVIVCVYTAMFHQDMKPLFSSRDGGLFASIVAIAGAFAFPIIYRVFYEPVVVYETDASEQELLAASTLSVYGGLVLWLVAGP